MDYAFLQEYKVNEEVFSTTKQERILKRRHCFFDSSKVDIALALERLNPFPVSLVVLNLLEGEYRNDKRIRQTVEQHDIEKQLLFFEEKSGEFLSISREAIGEEHAVYYKDRKLTDSLYDFIKTYHEDKSWLEYVLER